MSKGSIKKRKLRKAVDFDLNPPRCSNCVNFLPPVHGVPDKKSYRAPQCTKHEFEVKTTSICNAWVSRSGEVLEASN